MMGTSGSSGGPGSGTPLVPSWLDEPMTEPLPANVPQDGQDGADDSDGGDAGQQPQVAPPIAPPDILARFQGARRNFSSFAGSGGNDSGALRRAVRDYVRSGTGGSANAVRRMGASRAAAGNVLGVFRGFQRDGVNQTLQYLNLANLVGQSPTDVFLGLTEVVCPDGGSIDEGIARDAWLETITELDQLGIDDMASLTIDQMQEFFLAFVANAVESRLFQDIGAKGLSIASDLSSIESFERQFKDYVRRAVRDAFSGELGDLQSLSDQRIRGIVDQTYKESWELLELWGDAEE